MSKGLTVVGEEIKLEKWPIGDIAINCITKSFKINFKEIKLVAISPRLALDDEVLIITLIDEKQNFYQFSNYEFGKEGIKEIERKLNLNSIRNLEWEKFSWEDHEDEMTDKVIYPKEFYWEDLFVQSKNFKRKAIQVLKFFAIIESISGRLNPKLEKYLKRENEIE